MREATTARVWPALLLFAPSICLGFAASVRLPGITVWGALFGGAVLVGLLLLGMARGVSILALRQGTAAGVLYLLPLPLLSAFLLLAPTWFMKTLYLALSLSLAPAIKAP